MTDIPLLDVPSEPKGLCNTTFPLPSGTENSRELLKAKKSWYSRGVVFLFRIFLPDTFQEQGKESFISDNMTN